MNWTFWTGIILAGGALAFSFLASGGRNLFNTHGVIAVLGGTFVAILINCPLKAILSMVRGVLGLFLPSRSPGVAETIAEMTRLARRAQTQGGLLSLQGSGGEFAGGFLARTINVAISTGESNETRRILEVEVRQLRMRRQEDANILRTMGTFSPMFGLLGTLLGMIRVLETISSPTKVGPAMALALSSAFVGIGFATMVCIPIAGQLRLQAMSETLLLEMILEGVLDIASGKPPSLVELHLQSYAEERRREQRAPAAAAPGAQGAV